MIRLSWDNYFLSFLPIIAARSTCDRGMAAALLVKDKRIIATGYSGSVSGQPHCSDIGHLIIKQLDEDGNASEHCVRTQHSEMNCISQAAKNGISTENATIYISMEPCFVCCKMLLQCGIKRIVCLKQYHNARLSRELCISCGIELIVINDEEEKY